MRTVLFVASALIFSFIASAQSDRGTHHRHSHRDHSALSSLDAPIVARHLETSAMFQAAASATGNYTLSQLPTGTYRTECSRYRIQDLRSP